MSEPFRGPPSPWPWNISGQADEQGNWKIADADDRWVARVHFRDTTPSATRESIANANLIRAAPELLVALRAAQKRLCDDCCPTKWKTGEPMPHCPECGAARVAIALAEGR